jgi:hypothetical protein
LQWITVYVILIVQSDKLNERVGVMGKTRIIYLKADEEEAKVTYKENDYKEGQALVKGNLEVVSLGDNIVLWINEEGKLNGLTTNFNLIHQGKVADVVVGDVYFTGRDYEGDEASLTDEQIGSIEKMFINRRNMNY